MNPAAVHTLVHLPPDPVVYLAEIRTVGRPRSCSDSLAFYRLTVARSHVPNNQERCAVSKSLMSVMSIFEDCLLMIVVNVCLLLFSN